MEVVPFEDKYEERLSEKTWHIECRFMDASMWHSDWIQTIGENRG